MAFNFWKAEFRLSDPKNGHGAGKTIAGRALDRLASKLLKDTATPRWREQSRE
jgi:hypothetical protein